MTSRTCVSSHRNCQRFTSRCNCEKTRQAACLPLRGGLGEAWHAANCSTERHTVTSGRRTLGPREEGRKEESVWCYTGH